MEIFLHLERLATHPRSRYKNGKRIFVDAHFPPASQAYYEATPQKLLSQSRFIHPELNRLFVDLFNTDIFGHLRRCQGFVRSCTREINTAGHEVANLRIAAAIATMRRYDKFRVPYSKRCSHRHANRPEPRKKAEKSCGVPEIPCCVTSVAPIDSPTRTPLSRPLHFRRV